MKWTRANNATTVAVTKFRFYYKDFLPQSNQHTTVPEHNAEQQPKQHSSNKPEAQAQAQARTCGGADRVGREAVVPGVTLRVALPPLDRIEARGHLVVMW
jgi:hypothetical protein